MTIQELAKELDVSRQAIYQRCKYNNVDINTLTTETENGKKDLTPDGERIIRGLYSKDFKQPAKQEKKTGSEEQGRRILELEQKGKAQSQRIEELERIREKQKGEISILRTETEHLRREKTETEERIREEKARAEELIRRERETAEGRITGQKAEAEERLSRIKEDYEEKLRTAEEQLSRERKTAEDRLKEQKELYEERLRTAEDQLRRQEEQAKEYRQTAEEQIRQANERIKEAHIIAVTAQRELTASRESRGLLGWLRRLGSGKKQENGGGEKDNGGV